MDYRKLIKFGESSHVISLPTHWVKKNNLKKGDVIYFEENGNNEIILRPQDLESGEQQPKEIVLTTTGKDLIEINREIIAAYINDYNIINIIDDDLVHKSHDIKQMIHNLVALELITQSKNKLVARDFLNIQGDFLDTMLRRMDTLLRGMIQDALSIDPQEACTGICKNLEERDGDVNRFAFLIFRVLRKAANEPRLMKKLAMHPIDLIEGWNLAYALEDLGDGIKRIARTLCNMRVQHKDVKPLTDMFLTVTDLFCDAMKAYHTDDAPLASVVLQKRHALLPQCNALHEQVPLPETHVLVEHMKTMINDIMVIARIPHYTHFHPGT